MAKALEDIIFNNWQSGIAQSPYVGFADMQNVSISEKPGALLINFKPTKRSGTTITNLPTWIVQDDVSSKYFTLDTDGKLYKSTDTITWTLLTGNTLPSAGAGGQGLAVWRNYVFVARAAALDVMSISAETWSNSWQAIQSDTFAHPMVHTQDDKLTGGAGRYVFTLQETSGTTFLPSDSGTYTFTAQKLTLPSKYRVRCLAELGLDLKIGTWISSTSNQLFEQKTAVIFGWDRVSTSFAGSRTVFVSENGVSQMLAVNGILYFVAGLRGNLYATTGGGARLLKQFKSITFADSTSLNPRPGAIASHRNKLLIGMSADLAAVAGGTPLGVYSYDLDTGAVVLENLISTGSGNNTTQIGALFSSRDVAYLIGWKQDSAQGIDQVGASNYRTTSYGALADTDLRAVGVANFKRPFSTVHILLGRDLASDEGIRVKWRKALDDGFTTMGTYDFATYGAVSEIVADASIPDVTKVQLRIEATTGASSETSPELMEVRLS